MRWPPQDTDRNRFLFTGAVVVGTLATAYFLTFALASGALLPWILATLLLAATLVAGIGLLLMRARRRSSS